MTAQDFHNKCDNKGKTICLFLNDKNNIFGGYSSIPWTSDGGDKTAKDCFLFTLTNIYNTEPTKFPYIKLRSVGHYCNNGPLFGWAADLYVFSPYGNPNVSGFPYSYQDVLGKGKSIFTGDFNSSFKLKEMEIFKVS